MNDTTTSDLAEALAAGANVIDVRERSEYAEGHIPGALNVPMSELTGRVDEIDRTGPVHVVCASGNRSAAMVDVLRAHGFDARNVVGGTSAWIRAGHPIEK